jgi:hypothetical protein
VTRRRGCATPCKDDQILWRDHARSCTVDADHSRSPLLFVGTGLEPVAVIDVPDANRFLLFSNLLTIDQLSSPMMQLSISLVAPIRTASARTVRSSACPISSNVSPSRNST